jgi:predicted oxidoreductase (fatty acid repression mutant protein)
MSAFLDSLKKRRSIYALGRNTEVSEETIVETLKAVVKHTPSAFNSQTSRVLFVFGEANQKLWSLAADDLKKLLGITAENLASFESTEQRLNSFAAGIGTALFFEDMDIVKNLQEQYPLYAENFPIWSEQSSGMACANAWVAISELGLGGSLQHYNPVIDKSVATEWSIPAQWKLRAQLVFGSVEAPAREKEFMNDADRFIVAK